MLIAVTADSHLGNHTAFSGVEIGRINRRCQQILDCLRASLERSLAKGCDTYIIAGDVFDNDHPFPDLIAAVQSLFREFKRRGLDILLLVGNHDQHSNTPRDHALAPFAEDFKVFETPAIIDRLPRVLLLPFGHSPLDQTTSADIVIAHHGISEDTTHPAKAGGSGVIRVEKIREWMRATGCTYYLSGDWHEHRMWDDGPQKVCQIGALAPVNWTNRAYVPYYNDPYGSLITVTENGIEREVIPGPRFARAVSLTEVELIIGDTQAENNIPYIDFIGGSLEEVPVNIRHLLRTSGVEEQDQRSETKKVQESVSETSVDEAFVQLIDEDEQTPIALRPLIRETVIQALKAARCQT